MKPKAKKQAKTNQPKVILTPKLREMMKRGLDPRHMAKWGIK